MDIVLTYWKLEINLNCHILVPATSRNINVIFRVVHIELFQGKVSRKWHRQAKWIYWLKVRTFKYTEICLSAPDSFKSAFSFTKNDLRSKCSFFVTAILLIILEAFRPFVHIRRIKFRYVQFMQGRQCCMDHYGNLLASTANNNLRRV